MNFNLNSVAIIAIFSLLVTSCSDSSDISSARAMSLVDTYIADNPIFETAKFETQQIRLNSSKDKKDIENLQSLEAEEYIVIVDQKKRKKWFSKDSVFIITPTLTEKSYPYVVKQNKNNVEVKTIIYDVDRTQEVTFDKKTDKQATFNVLLLKEKTPYYYYGKDSNPNSDFITRKFKAKYHPERGWELVK